MVHRQAGAPYGGADAEAVKPALQLLSGKPFVGPQQEFLKAHQHYRAGDHRKAVAMAANAVESTFKAIFDQKGWQSAKGARISDLLRVAERNTLWPDYLDGSFDQLSATLTSGLPKIRDNDASHGQGAEPKEVPAYVAAYAIHLAASAIIFVVEAAKAKKNPQVRLQLRVMGPDANWCTGKPVHPTAGYRRRS